MENGTDESTRNLGQLAETKHYKSPVSEIQVVEDGLETDYFVRILTNSAEQNPHNKNFHKECADELLQQHISQRPSLKDLLCFPVEDESSVQNSTRDFEELGVDANAATDEQYSEDPLDDYERRRIYRPLLEFKGGSSSAVDKPQWRKKIEGIFAKVGLRLLCCSSAGVVVRGKNGKPEDREQQLQKYVSEHYSYAW